MLHAGAGPGAQGDGPQHRREVLALEGRGAADHALRGRGGSAEALVVRAETPRLGGRQGGAHGPTLAGDGVDDGGAPP